MDFKEELKAAAEKCADNQRNSMDHQVRQAFFAGVGWYMKYLSDKTTAASKPVQES